MFYIDQLLQRAIDLIDAGNKTGGRELLQQAIQTAPDNADAWYVYAQYCGKRSQAIYALQRVLELDPTYPGARQKLEAISIPNTPATPPPQKQSAFVTLEENDPWNRSLLPDPNIPPVIPGKMEKNSPKQPGMPRWFLVTCASLLGLIILGGMILAGLFITGNTTIARASAPLPAQTAIPPTLTPTLTPLVLNTPTMTPDPCTCEVVSLYMDDHAPRINQLLAEMRFATKKLNSKRLTKNDLATLVQNASTMYDNQRNAKVPYCLEAYQKNAVKMFWTWEQAVKAIQDGDTDGALAFIQIITNDSSGLDRQMSKLLTHSNLQSCNFAFPTLSAPSGWLPKGQEVACNQ